ncbi:MAG: FG-GAP-like repeat-containing protein [Phycisphaerales bacterium]|nr:FG-GAP-like repeat-containing protein [Phycisphaerales bacterium]
MRTATAFLIFATVLLAIHTTAVAGDPPVEWCPDWSQRLMHPNSMADDDFGWSVSMAGEIAVVGRPRTGHNNTWEGRGDAHVYRWDETVGEWNYEGSLVQHTSLNDTDSTFGKSVHTDGVRIIVGAPGAIVDGKEAQGRGFVFHYVNDNWALQHELYLAGGDAYDRLGESVAIDGTSVLMGAPGYANTWSVGSTFLWSLNRSLEPVNMPPPSGGRGTTYISVGLAIAVDDDRVVIGAPDTHTAGVNHGAAWVYSIAGGTWNFIQNVGPQGPWAETSGYYGSSVDIHDQRIAIGAPAAYNSNEPSHVQTWTYTNSTWAADTAIVDTPIQARTEFGAAVSITNERLAVGVPFADDQGSWSGHVAMFTWSPSGGFWSPQARILNYLGSAIDHFGKSLALSNTKLMVGAPGAETPNQWWSTGAAFYYTLRDDGTWQEDLRPTLAVRTQSAEIIDPTASGANGTDDNFATTMARSGNTLLIGDPGEDVVHVYNRTTSSSPWILDTVNQISTPAAVNNWGTFGSALTIDGDVAIIGATDFTNFTGAHVWMTQRDENGVWSEPAEIFSDFGFRLGKDIATQVGGSFRWVAIGLPSTMVPVGAEGEVAMVIINSDGSVNSTFRLTDSDWDGAEFSAFGVSLDMEPVSNGLQLAVGNTGDDGVGSVKIYGASPSTWWTWQEIATLHGDSISGLTHAKTFGISVDLDGDYLAVGDREGGFREAAGKACVFQRSNWSTFDLKLACDSPFEGAYDWFGNDVLIQDGATPRLTIGAPGSNYMSINAGAICSWVLVGNEWLPAEILVASNPILEDGLGGRLCDDVDGVLGGCTSEFGETPQARVLEFKSFNRSIYDGGDLGELSDQNAWTIPPGPNFTTGLFSLLLEPMHTVSFDQQVWDGGFEVLYSNMDLHFNNSLRFIRGDLDIGADPLVRASHLLLKSGEARINGKVSVGNGEQSSGTLALSNMDARIDGGLVVHSGSSLAYTIDPNATTVASAEWVDLSGTLSVQSTSSEFKIGDRITLLTSDSSPDGSLFELIVLPGLEDGKAFQLIYGAPGRRNNCPDGEIEDCNGNCAPDYWVGDNYCDDGTYSWNGVPIYFNCPEFGCDGGDCDDPDCENTAAWEVSLEVVSLEGLLGFDDPSAVVVPGSPTAVEVVDLTNDGAEEICVTFAGSPGMLAIFENDGEGGVAQQILLPVHDGPIDLTSGDFDGDGTEDLAVGHAMSNDVLVLYNTDADPSDGFVPHTLPATGPVLCVTRADLDQFQPVDLMACIDDTNGDGEGAWQWWISGSGIRGGLGGGGNQGSGPGIIPIFGDPSEDEGQKDIIVHGGTANGRSMVVKSGAGGLSVGQFLNFDLYPVGAELGGVAAGDYDGDGLEDLAYTSAENSTVVLLRHNPNSIGTYLPPIAVPVGESPTDITAIDFDLDGDIDLAVVAYEDGEPRVRVLQNNGNLLFTSVDTAEDEGVVLVDAGDVSGDGVVELVTVGGSANARGIASLLSVRSSESAPCIGDIDADGHVNIDDLMSLLAQWGPCGNPCSADFDLNGTVNIDDMLLLIGAWGSCPR